ncbi:MAG: DUF1801 domain-containing protein [Niabella sp.]
MAKLKTIAMDTDVSDFIHKINNAQQQEDSMALLKVMEDVSGHPPKMWGAGIIGFGAYHYKYDSGHKGDTPLLSFSPRKTAISLYVFTGQEEHKHLLDNLGKYKMGKACIYIKKLSDIQVEQLKVIMRATLGFLKSKYGA